MAPTNVVLNSSLLQGSSDRLFTALEKLCQGRPFDLIPAIEKMRSGFTSERAKRPAGYMNDPRLFSGYTAYHLPLHLPELFWILDQSFERFKLQAPKHVLDLASGPGTASLSAALWLQSHEKKLPLSWTLADQSARALKGAQTLFASIEVSEPKVLKRNLLHEQVDVSKADWIFISYFLNEMGNGPRYRDRKLEWLGQYFDAAQEGSLFFVIEPPLREPTLDLMWLRDAIVEHGGFEIVAPCPAGALVCPMARLHMGWCYAQPPRTWARAQYLAPWDREIERALEINWTQPGFSYLVIRKLKQNSELKEASPTTSKVPEKNSHRIAVSDGRAGSGKVCNGKNIITGKVIHRGAYIKVGGPT